MAQKEQPELSEVEEMTQYAVDELYGINYQLEDVFEKGFSYIKSFDRNFFCEGLYHYIQRHPQIEHPYNGQQPVVFEGDLDQWKDAKWKENWEEVFDFVTSCYAAAGIPGDRSERGYNKSVLKDWLSAKKLPSATNRENFYKLCFALHMNEKETAEFFLKAFLIKPFNYKRMEETVYYFCLKQGNSYADACRIIREILAEVSDAKPPQENVATMQLGCMVAQIDSEDNLKAYFRETRTEYARYNEVAVNKIKELYKDIQGYVKEEYEKSICHLIDAAWDDRTEMDSEIKKEKARKEKVRINPEKKDNRDAVVNIMLGFETGSERNTGSRNMDKISNSGFTELIKVNFPQSQQVSNIFTQERPSDDAVRKTLILFTFYKFFAMKRSNKWKGLKEWPAHGEAYNADGEHFNEFEGTVNGSLLQAGFSQMYWKHPYDWMFGFCAGTEDPIQTLRELIDEFCFAQAGEK